MFDYKVQNLIYICFIIFTFKTYYWLGAQPNELSDKFRLVGTVGAVPVKN